MVKKNKKEQEVIINEIIDNDRDDLKELSELVGEGEYKVSAYKLSSDGTQWEKIGQYPLDQFNPDEIAKSYGGGKFKFRVLDSEGKFVRQMTVPYAIIKHDEKQDKKEEILEFIKTELTSRDMLLSKLIENLKPNTQQGNLTELITALSTLKSMSSEKNNLSEFINILKLGMNMTKELQEVSNVDDRSVEDKFLSAMVEKLLPNVLNLIGSGGISNTPRKPPLPPQPISKNNNDTGLSMNENYISPFEKELVEKFKIYEKPLLSQSFSKDTIQTTTDIILQMLNDDDILQLEKYLKEYSYFRIINYIPSLSGIKDWLKLLVENILKNINELKTDDVEVSTDEVEVSTDDNEIKNSTNDDNIEQTDNI